MNLTSTHEREAASVHFTLLCVPKRPIFISHIVVVSCVIFVPCLNCRDILQRSCDHLVRGYSLHVGMFLQNF